jgi:glycosyltransferase involved in cell wall biosynthesis
MKVFLAVKSLLPSYGGPAFSVSQLAHALAKAGLEVAVWASDASAVQSCLLSPGGSLRAVSGSVAGALEQCGQVDVLHDNGIWLPHNHYLAGLAAERGLVRVVSTRGMLEPSARNHKAWKKRIAWWLYQRHDLCRASYHHATAAAEAQTLRILGLGVPIGIIPNGITVLDADLPRGEHKELRTALFLGRIHPIKGISVLIEAWAKLRPQNWQLLIAGPDELGHRAELKKKVCAASLSGAVRFSDPLNGDAKDRAFANADLFVLPSFSESFGMVIGEALAHGLPVLTTTATPWKTIAVEGCGWSVSPTIAGLLEGLSAATSLDRSALLVMGERGREMVSRQFSWANIAEQFINAYEKLLVARVQDRHLQ